MCVTVYCIKPHLSKCNCSQAVSNQNTILNFQRPSLSTYVCSAANNCLRPLYVY
jgi:hypothetical protein